MWDISSKNLLGSVALERWPPFTFNGKKTATSYFISLNQNCDMGQDVFHVLHSHSGIAWTYDYGFLILPSKNVGICFLFLFFSGNFLELHNSIFILWYTTTIPTILCNGHEPNKESQSSRLCMIMEVEWTFERHTATWTLT